MNCAFCKHHNCYVKEQNCTRYSKEEAAALYTEQDVKIMFNFTFIIVVCAVLCCA